MEDSLRQIALFPLVLLPLPGELVPLHIFEPRYRQLLTDMEQNDICFGVYCNHDLNKTHIGSVMKLETVIKRYKTGESDIIVRCVDVFSLEKMYRTWNGKLYPGGDVRLWVVNHQQHASGEVSDLFAEFQQRRNISHKSFFSIYQMGAELNMDLFERYRLLTSPPDKASSLLLNHLKFQLHLLTHEDRARDLYHLN